MTVDLPQFADLPTVFFSTEFLIDHVVPSDGWRVRPNFGDHRSGWLQEGTLVKLEEPRRVWSLTGHRDRVTGYYEGRWPD